jgi:hypothetical protein
VLDELDRQPPKALIFRSGKSAGFIAGADIQEFTQLDSAEKGRELVELRDLRRARPGGRLRRHRALRRRRELMALTRADAARIARNRIRITPDAQLDPASVDKTGSTVNIFTNAVAALAEELEARSEARFAAQLVAGGELLLPAADFKGAGGPGLGADAGEKGEPAFGGLAVAALGMRAAGSAFGVVHV